MDLDNIFKSLLNNEVSDGDMAELEALLIGMLNEEESKPKEQVQEKIIAETQDDSSKENSETQTEDAVFDAVLNTINNFI